MLKKHFFTRRFILYERTEFTAYTGHTEHKYFWVSKPRKCAFEDFEGGRIQKGIQSQMGWCDTEFVF